MPGNRRKWEEIWMVEKAREIKRKAPSSKAGRGFSGINGGEAGIRTLGTVAGSLVFETSPFDRSGTSPCANAGTHTLWKMATLSRDSRDSFRNECSVTPSLPDLFTQTCCQVVVTSLFFREGDITPLHMAMAHFCSESMNSVSSLLLNAAALRFCRNAAGKRDHSLLSPACCMMRRILPSRYACSSLYPQS